MESAIIDSSTRQPLPLILHLSYLQISVLPEAEGFLMMLYGLSFAAFPLGVWSL